MNKSSLFILLFLCACGEKEIIEKNDNYDGTSVKTTMSLELPPDMKARIHAKYLFYKEVEEYVAQGEAILLDTREKKHFVKNSIKNSKNFPVNDILKKGTLFEQQFPNKDIPIVIFNSNKNCKMTKSLNIKLREKLSYKKIYFLHEGYEDLVLTYPPKN